MTRSDMTIDLGISSLQPSQKQLTEMIQQAQKHVGKVVRAEWKTEKDVYRFFLQAEIKANAGSSVPEWTLRRLSEEDFSAVSKHLRGEDVVFQIVTGDVGLLLNLIWSECTGTNQEVDESLQLKTFDHVKTAIGRNASSGKSETALAANTNTVVDTGSFARFDPPSTAGEQDSTPNTVMLSGDLSDVELPGVMQSIQICNMVGRLDIRDGLSQVELFFVDGEVVHATLNNAIINDATGPSRIGDSVVLDVLTWHRGNFFFKKATRTTERSVKRRLAGLLLEAACLRDYSQYTTKAGVDENTVLESTKQLSESELKEIFENGVNVDIGKQVSFYQAINGISTVGDIVQRLGLLSSIWLPTLFNILSNDLAAPAGMRKVSAEVPPASSITVSEESLSEAAKQLINADTGMFGAAMFLHFLRLELARYTSKRSVFSIGLFEFKIKSESPSKLALQQMSECFDTLKEKFDILGQIGDCEFALLMPLRNAMETKELLESFAAKLVQIQLDGLSFVQDLHLAFGVADAVDTSSIEQMLKEAEQAKQMAIKKRYTCGTFRECCWQELKEKAHALDAENLIAIKATWSSALGEARRVGNKEGQLEITLRALADVCLRLKDFALAEKCLIELLDLKRKIFGAADESVHKTALVLIDCYSVQGKYAEAEDCYVKIVREFLLVKGTNSPESPVIVNDLVNFYRTWKQLQKASEVSKHVVEMITAIYGAADPRTARAQKNYDELRALART